MTRQSVGRVKMTGNVLEDTAAALALAARMNGQPATDQDIEDVLRRQGGEASPENVAAVRKLLP